MGTIFFRKITLGLVLGFLLLSNTQNTLYAQDEGPPAMKIIAMSSMGGAAVGTILGVALWLLDPLADDADIRTSVLGAMGIGTLAGAGFGIFELQETMILPVGPEVEEEVFEEEIGYQMVPFQPDNFPADRQKKIARGIPIFRFRYRF